MYCSRYFDYLKCEKRVDFFLSLASLARNYENLLILEYSVSRDYLKILFVSFVELGRCFSELVKGICHLSAARRQIGCKTAVFWAVKNWIWSVKSQGILFLHEGGHPDTASRGIMQSRQWTTMVLIRLLGCAGWVLLSLFAYGIRQVFSWCHSLVIQNC